MGARPKHRDRLVRAAAELFRQRGYAATGINDILGLAAAPKGSFYHYFPGGKEALGAEAVRYAGDRVTETLQTLQRDPPPAAALRLRGAPGRLAEGFRLPGRLPAGHHRAGGDAPVRADHGGRREAYAAWRRTLATLIDLITRTAPKPNASRRWPSPWKAP